MNKSTTPVVEPFSQALERRHLSLTRTEPSTLQVNTGLLCNLACRHCHLEAGPGRTEVMGAETVGQVIEFAARHPLPVIDITGGAPEMNPHITDLISGLAPLTGRLMLRSNLVAMGADGCGELMALCRRHRVAVVASFPALNEAQAESQRGSGVFSASLEILRRLNSMGYGKAGSGLELHLVSNPAGAFMPAAQRQLEERFHRVLREKWGVEFNNLFAFANVPLGRFRRWLLASGNYGAYMEKLAAAFNPCALNGVMCRSIISVNWDGYLYDCDFNLAMDLPLGGTKVHITELTDLPRPGSGIAVSDHCYACTAGAGFT